MVLVLAVDNIATRKMVNKLIMEDLVEMEIPTLAFDSGNDNQGGQVVLYANAPVTHTPPMGTPEKGMLPTMLQMFPELATIEDDNPGLVMDCAENAESEPQGHDGECPKRGAAGSSHYPGPGTSQSAGKSLAQ